MKVLLTGASGFIGKHTRRALVKAGHDVLALARHGTDVTIVDLADKNTWIDRVRNFSPDSAIHLAWEGIPDYGAEMSARNLLSSLALYDGLTTLGVKRIVGAGSAWEKTRENAFTAAKIASRVIGTAFAAERDAGFLWTRIFFVYGPGQRAEALIPSMVRSLMTQSTVQVKTPGVQNDFIYIDDVVQALILLATSSACSGTYEIGSTIATRVDEVARIVHAEFEIEYSISPSPTVEAVLADTKSLTALGWTPQVPLATGIGRTVKWLRDSK